MKIALIVFSLFLVSVTSIAQTKSINQVKDALDRQVKAWNTGQLEEAMAYYHDSADLLWVSRAGIEKGYQPILESYLKDFADRKKMGIYSYEPLHIESLSSKSVFYVYRWKIELNGKKIMGGVSSQIWKKKNKSWLIFTEHAS